MTIHSRNTAASNSDSFQTARATRGDSLVMAISASWGIIDTVDGAMEATEWSITSSRKLWMSKMSPGTMNAVIWRFPSGVME